MWITGAPTFSFVGTVITGVVVVWLLVNAISGPRTFRRLMAAENRLNLTRFFQINLAVQWLGVALVLLVLFTSPGLTGGHLGLALPSGGLSLFAIGLAAYVAVVALIGRWRVQRRIARGLPVRVPRAVAILRPNTPAERRLAIAMSVTAGIAEELMFRGLLIAAGVGILGLPILWSALLSVFLFAAAHLYQGPASIGAGVIGLAFTVSYLYCGSLLPVVVAHIVVDIAGLTVPTPSVSEPTSAPDAKPEPSTVLVHGSSEPSSVSCGGQAPPLRPAAPFDDESAEPVI